MATFSRAIAALIVVGLLIIVAAVAVTRIKQPAITPTSTPSSTSLTVTAMQLTSPAFEPNQTIPSLYTCDGDNISPPLAITGVPAGAKSLVLIMDDPDVPATVRADRMWDHWVVFNIPPDVREVPEGQEPAGVHGRGTSGNLTYHGPCPPDREHRYFFKLYALGTMLDLSEGSSKAQVEQAMAGHIIEQAELVGVYNRQ